MSDMKVFQEILLIDKPKGISSFDVIRRLRRKYGIKKMGHAGTLDPLASGLMIIGIGFGTKKLNTFLKLPKVYEVQILLGIETTTGDMEGKILRKESIKEIDRKKLQKILKGMVGKLHLAVPVYSAIKVAGRPLYKLAREGKKNISTPIKEMEIYWCKLINHFPGHYPEKDKYILQIELEVKSGTYIRSIVQEIGKQMNFPATVKELRRTRIGDFSIVDAKSL